MIISGYQQDPEEDDQQEQSSSWTVRKEDRTNSQQVQDLIKNDEVLREKVRNHEPITDADVIEAQNRVNEDFKIHAKHKQQPQQKTQKQKQRESLDLLAWDFLEKLEKNNLYKKKGKERSMMAFNILYKNIKPTSGYLIPGQVATFRYDDPATKEQLEWWDKTPCTIFFGYVKNKDGYIRELGFNLHYYPPYIRKKIMQRIFIMFKKHFMQNFSKPSKAKLSGISYQRLLNALKSAKLAAGVREYIPGLRTQTRVIPTKYLPTACFTEGNFSGATIQEIYNFWKNYSIN